MAATTKTKKETRVPVVIIDNAEITYKVFASGRRATRGNSGGGLLSKKMKLQAVHAVKGVSFTVYEGESIGIIGSNGSGKSSLMSALAGLTPLTGGAIYASARPNLLGVGGLLLPNLSGEKNILLGGLAMGFTKKEIAAKVDDITEFAGLQDFVGLPMRTYSQGMSARLRFAIAASKDHDILIIDEALAVGDQEFRNRSEARMREMRENAGTVFLVSHSMKSIIDTCTRVIWIEKGELRMDGDPKKVTAAYNKFVGSTTVD
ncbi:MAG: ABC transporter ATP-binding protein [Micrococcales bacterium]